MRQCGMSLPPIIFERLKLPQQVIYRRKENLLESANHFKYWKNILIFAIFRPFLEVRKNFKLLEHKHTIYHFEAGDLEVPIYNLFHENSNFAVLQKHFRILQNTLLLLSLRNLNISQNKLYSWNYQITCFKIIYNMFIF